MIPESQPIPTPSGGTPIPDWAKFALAIVLTIVVCVLDLNPPLNRPFSNLYFLIAAYSALCLRGRAEFVAYVTIIICDAMMPFTLRPWYFNRQVAYFNRLSGLFYGLLMVALIRSRRAYIASLKSANEGLEQKVALRTAELQQEIAERTKIDNELRASRQRLEKLSRQLIASIEGERRHLARELHDEIGQVLTAIRMGLSRTEQESDNSVRSNLQSNMTMVDNAIRQVRNLTLSLRPPQLDELGLLAALHWIVKQQAASGNCDGRLEVDPPDIQLPSDLDIVCFRIAQEALTNAVRHAKPAKLLVKLTASDDQLQLSIQDDGVGFDVHESFLKAVEGASVGLISMNERANLVGGEFTVESTPGDGTTIRATFPLSETR